MTKEVKNTIDLKLKELEKRYGLQKADVNETKSVSSGSYMIDIATGINGYPLGKIVEIYGPESSGKSTIALEAIAMFQKTIPDKKVALIDYEYSFDVKYAKSLGINTQDLLIYQPDDQESGYDMIVALASEGICSLIVIDSHTAAIPKKIIDGEMGDSTIGLQARNNSKFLGKIKSILDRTGTTLFAISQTRVNIGGMGELNVPTGGSSWKFYADMRLKVWKKNDLPGSRNVTTVDVVKNKCAVPFGKAEFDIVWGLGIDNLQEIIDIAIEKEVVKQSGAWFTYNESKYQGVASIKRAIEEDATMLENIKALIL